MNMQSLIEKQRDTILDEAPSIYEAFGDIHTFTSEKLTGNRVQDESDRYTLKGNISDQFPQPKRRKISFGSPSLQNGEADCDTIIINSNKTERFVHLQTSDGVDNQQPSLKCSPLHDQQETNKIRQSNMLTNGTDKLVEQTLVNLEPHIARLVYESLRSSIQQIHQHNSIRKIPISNENSDLIDHEDGHLKLENDAKTFRSSFSVGNLTNSTSSANSDSCNTSTSSLESARMGETSESRNSSHPHQTTELTMETAIEPFVPSFSPIDACLAHPAPVSMSCPITTDHWDNMHTTSTPHTKPGIMNSGDNVKQSCISGTDFRRNTFVSSQNLITGSRKDHTTSPLPRQTFSWNNSNRKIRSGSVSPFSVIARNMYSPTFSQNDMLPKEQINQVDDEQTEAIPLVVRRNATDDRTGIETHHLTGDRIRRRRSKVIDVQPTSRSSQFLISNHKALVPPFSPVKSGLHDANFENLLHLHSLLSSTHTTPVEPSNKLTLSGKMEQLHQTRMQTNEMNFDFSHLNGSRNVVNGADRHNSLSPVKCPNNWMGETEAIGAISNYNLWSNSLNDPYMMFHTIFAKAFRKLVQTPNYNTNPVMEKVIQKNCTTMPNFPGWFPNKAQFDTSRSTTHPTGTKLNLKAKLSDDMSEFADAVSFRHTFGRRSDKRSFENPIGSPGRYNSGEDFDTTYEESMRLTTTLTPVHLRKAKLMFFYTRYPNSTLIKIYFPDVKFNKNNTAQLVKWFSNFREFYYIQMEKYARIAISEGVRSAESIHVTTDSELYRALNLHYNRNQQLVIPDYFRVVTEATLKEFFNALISGKDNEQSWKKPIYKIIARMDQPVPEFFKNLNWMEQLADG